MGIVQGCHFIWNAGVTRVRHLILVEDQTAQGREIRPHKWGNVHGGVHERDQNEDQRYAPCPPFEREATRIQSGFAPAPGQTYITIPHCLGSAPSRDET